MSVHDRQTHSHAENDSPFCAQTGTPQQLCEQKQLSGGDVILLNTVQTCQSDTHTHILRDTHRHHMWEVLFCHSNQTQT